MPTVGTPLSTVAGPRKARGVGGQMTAALFNAANSFYKLEWRDTWLGAVHETMRGVCVLSFAVSCSYNGNVVCTCIASSGVMS